MPLGPRARLLLLSFTMLFVELALIRWTGSNVLYLSYFSNFVLLGSFLGIGIGFLRARAERDLSPWAPVALFLLVAFVLAFPVQIDASGTDLLFFGGTRTGLPPWVTLPVVFLAVAAVMETIGEAVARAFIRFSPLEAYSLDVLGSLVGIAAFSLLSFTWAPPVAWGAVAAACMVGLAGRRMRVLTILAAAAMVALLGFESSRPALSWSPYYKVTVTPFPGGNGQIRYSIAVNGIPHQTVESVNAESYQNLPYKHDTRLPRDVLIIGAGNGRDVSVALAWRGARRRGGDRPQAAATRRPVEP